MSKVEKCRGRGATWCETACSEVRVVFVLRREKLGNSEIPLPVTDQSASARVYIYLPTISLLLTA